MCKYAYNQRSGLSGSKGRQCYQTAKPPDKCKRSLLFCCNCFIIIFVFFFATQECLYYENLIFAVSLRKTSSVVTLTWNLIRQQMKTRNQNKMKVRTISTLVCCVGVFQWGKAGTYSNLQNRAKFCGTQLNPYYQRGGGKCSIHKRRKEGYGLGNYSPLVSIYLVLHISLLLSFSTADEDLKFILLKRPKISIVANYKINTKAAHNHFQRYSDVKAKGQCKLPHDFCESSSQPFFVMLRNL